MANRLEKQLAKVIVNLNKIIPKIIGVQDLSFELETAKKHCISRSINKLLTSLNRIIPQIFEHEDYSKLLVVKNAALNLKILEKELREFSLSYTLSDKKKYILDQLDDVEQNLNIVKTQTKYKELLKLIDGFISEYVAQTKDKLSKLPNLSQEDELTLVKSFSILAKKIQDINDELLDMNEPAPEIKKIIRSAVSDWNRVMKLVYVSLENAYNVQPSALVMHSKSQGVEGIKIKD